MKADKTTAIDKALAAGRNPVLSIEIHGDAVAVTHCDGTGHVYDPVSAIEWGLLQLVPWERRGSAMGDFIALRYLSSPLRVRSFSSEIGLSGCLFAARQPEAVKWPEAKNVWIVGHYLPTWTEEGWAFVAVFDTEEAAARRACEVGGFYHQAELNNAGEPQTKDDKSGNYVGPGDIHGLSPMKFLRDESGQDLVEYALIVAAVALALITSVTALSGGIASLYQSITGRLTGVEWQDAAR